MSAHTALIAIFAAGVAAGIISALIARRREARRLEESRRWDAQYRPRARDW